MSLCVEPRNLCRLCATLSANIISIFSEEGEVMQIAEKIGRCLPVIVVHTDTLPLGICYQCLKKLNISYNLILTSLNSEVILKDEIKSIYNDEEVGSNNIDLIVEKKLQEIEDCSNGSQEFKFQNRNTTNLLTNDDLKNQNICNKFQDSISGILVADGKNNRNCSNSKNEDIFINPILSVQKQMNGPAICDVCDTLFIDMKEFDQHVAKHLKEVKCDCRLCFKNKEEWNGREDISLNEADLKYDAEQYIKLSPTRDTNSLNLDNLTEILCEICQTNFKQEGDLLKHSKNHGITEIMCAKCGETCFSAYLFYQHVKSHQILTCDQCHKQFDKQAVKKFQKHVEECEKYFEKYECNVCSRNFLNSTALKVHSKSHAISRNESSAKLNSMECITCGKKFSDRMEFQRHRYVHDPALWDTYKCQVCNRRFRDKERLTNHMYLHIGDKPHMCDLCGRTYNRHSNMVKHRRLHKPKDQWTNECSICGDKFEYMRDLVLHSSRIHNQNNEALVVLEEDGKLTKWVCQTCGKRVSTKLTLLDHERVHTGVKPFICEWCGRNFRSRPNLLQHHLTHTGIRKHCCKVCGKRFSRKAFITQHMRVHTGEKPYICDICGHRFTQVGDMRRHRKRHETMNITISKV